MTISLVTGAARGIGLELCRQLAAQGHSVIAVCREPSTELKKLDLRVEAGVDVTEQGSLDRLAERLAGVEVNWLVNNAGILERQSLDSLDAAAYESMRQQFEVNSLGPLRVTHTLLGHLKAPGGKVGIVTSRMGSIADNDSGGSYGYRMSKAAANAAGVSLARDLAPRGIAVALLHPGYVRTDMTGNQGLVDAHQAAAGLIARLAELAPATSGRFWHANGEELPW